MRIISIDAEVDGLYGASFAIGAVVREEGREIDRFYSRLANLAQVRDEYCRDKIVPVLAEPAMDIPDGPALAHAWEAHRAGRDRPHHHASSDALEEAFWAFWLQHRETATPIAHCAVPVETGLVRRCVERDLPARMWLGPYPAIHDVATALLLAGRDPSTVDGYLKAEGIPVPFSGSPHHPLYDAIAAALVWERLA